MDYRKRLYQTYVSKFKGQAAVQDAKSLYSYIEWTKQKYGRFFSNLPKSADILELGCGHGAFMQFLKTLGFERVQGIDISREQIEIAKAKGLNAEAADVWDFLNNNASNYDLIIAIDFIEHFTKAELFQLLEQIHSKLRPNGILILQTPNGEGLFSGQGIYGDITHATILTPGSLKQLLKNLYFDDIQFFGTGPVAKNLTGMVRVFCWRLITFIATLAKLSESGKRQKIWSENFICCCKKNCINSLEKEV